MRRAIVEVIAFATFAVTVAALAALLSTSAVAGPRSGPGPLGLIALPLEIITHGIVRVPPTNPHPAAHAVHSLSSASLRAVAARASVSPPGPPAAGLTSEPPVEAPTEPAAANAAPDPASAPQDAPHNVQARADFSPAVPPPQPAALPAVMAPWPIASASVYEDLLGYVLWPADYADHLWMHGYGDIMNTLLTPTTATASADQVAGLIANGMCSSKAAELADRLIARTSTMIVPTPAQQMALDELSATLSGAIDRGRTSVCSPTGDPLKRMVDGLWTVWDATLLMRAPLEKFYNSLTDAQKTKLAGEAAAGQALARSCADPHTADWSGDRLAQTLGADQRQHLTLDALRERSSELIKFLAVSCPRESEPTPMDRLVAARERMNALLYVVISMSPALNELYGSLDVQPKQPFASAH